MLAEAPPNNGIHPTRFSLDVIRKGWMLSAVECGRVMPVVMPHLVLRSNIPLGFVAGRTC
jgi:hypothetical protein